MGKHRTRTKRGGKAKHTRSVFGEAAHLAAKQLKRKATTDPYITVESETSEAEVSGEQGLGGKEVSSSAGHTQSIQGHLPQVKSLDINGFQTDIPDSANPGRGCADAARSPDASGGLYSGGSSKPLPQSKADSDYGRDECQPQQRPE